MLLDALLVQTGVFLAHRCWGSSTGNTGRHHCPRRLILRTARHLYCTIYSTLHGDSRRSRGWTRLAPLLVTRASVASPAQRLFTTPSQFTAAESAVKPVQPRGHSGEADKLCWCVPTRRRQPLARTHQLCAAAVAWSPPIHPVACHLRQTW